MGNSNNIPTRKLQENEKIVEEDSVKETVLRKYMDSLRRKMKGCYIDITGKIEKSKDSGKGILVPSGKTLCSIAVNEFYKGLNMGKPYVIENSDNNKYEVGVNEAGRIKELDGNIVQIKNGEENLIFIEYEEENENDNNIEELIFSINSCEHNGNSVLVEECRYNIKRVYNKWKNDNYFTGVFETEIYEKTGEKINKVGEIKLYKGTYPKDYGFKEENIIINRSTEKGLTIGVKIKDIHPFSEEIDVWTGYYDEIPSTNEVVREKQINL